MSRKIGKEAFSIRVNKLTNGEYEVMSVYESSSKKIQIKHNKCNLTYSVTPNNFLKGRRCPYCAGKLAGPESSLAVKGKKFISEWDTDKNQVKPSEVQSYSNKKFWWKCIKGHTWQASPNSRMRGTNCPLCYCSRLRASAFKNGNKLIKILDDLKLDYAFEYRIPECRLDRPIPFSLAIFKKDKLIALVDYHNKYYSINSRWAKEDYCHFNNITYYCLELLNEEFTDEELADLEYWIKNLI